MRVVGLAAAEKGKPVGPGESVYGYRPEIDGLRALAILPVLFFHAGLETFSGGYTGVDIFFVISGYLITATLIRDHRHGQFSILNFYERRIRRILPALCVMLAAVAAAVFLLFAPEEGEPASQSLVATAAFWSNLLFFLEDDYFSIAGHLKPLVHGWSLAVEEQYYVVFPILMAILLGRRLSLQRRILLALAVTSFAFSVVAAGPAPSFNFYSPFTRAWEFLTGALLASASLPQKTSRRLAETGAIFGLALLLVPVFAYSSATPFPGLAAIPTVAGTALLIAVGSATVVGRLLSTWPLVWIGLISYSLYLWHWPILVFARYANLGPLDGMQSAAAIGAAVVLAWLSLRFVERPFRDPARFSRRAIFAMAGVALVTVAAIGLTGIATGGFAFRDRSELAPLVEARRQSAAFQADPCLKRGAAIGSCTIGRGPPTVALWGDSHAAQFVPLIDSLGRKMHFGARQFTKAGCLPVLADSFQPSSPMRRDCATFNRAVWAAIRQDSSLDIVILGGRWATFAQGESRVLAEPYPRSEAGSHAAIAAGIAQVAAEMKRRGGKLVVLHQSPIPPKDHLSCYRAASFNGWSMAKCGDGYSAAESQDRTDAVDRAFMRQIRSSGPHVIDMMDLLCDGGRCPTLDDDALLYLDESHLAPLGTEPLRQRLKKAIEGPSPAEGSAVRR